MWAVFVVSVFPDFDIHVSTIDENVIFRDATYNHIYQPLRSGRMWHKVNF